VCVSVSVSIYVSVSVYVSVASFVSVLRLFFALGQNCSCLGFESWEYCCHSA